MTLPSSIPVAVVVMLFVLGCAAFGGYLRGRLSSHLDGDTKDAVKATVGLLATLAALLLGLILASAKSTFEGISDEVDSAAAKLVLLDDNLRDMGPGADTARELLAQIAASRIGAIWGAGDRQLNRVALDSKETSATFVSFRRAIQSARTENESQQRAKARAIDLTDEVRQIRFLAQVRESIGIMTPILVLIVFWLGVISLGLNLFAPRNGTVFALNVLCALSVAAAIFLIIEMGQPYSGLFRVSPAPLKAALEQLRR